MGIEIEILDNLMENYLKKGFYREMRVTLSLVETTYPNYDKYNSELEKKVKDQDHQKD